MNFSIHVIYVTQKSIVASGGQSSQDFLPELRPWTPVGGLSFPDLVLQALENP